MTDSTLNEARDRLETIAKGLVVKLGPVDTGASFIAIGTTCIAAHLGKDGASQFLRELADDLDADASPEWGGRA